MANVGELTTNKKKESFKCKIFLPCQPEICGTTYAFLNCISSFLPTITYKTLEPWKKCACMNNKITMFICCFFGLVACNWLSIFWMTVKKKSNQALIDSLALHNFTSFFFINFYNFIIIIIIISSSWQLFFLFTFYRSYFILLNIKYNEFVLRYQLCACTLRLEYFSSFLFSVVVFGFLLLFLFNAYDLGVCGNQFDIWPLSIRGVGGAVYFSFFYILYFTCSLLCWKGTRIYVFQLMIYYYDDLHYASEFIDEKTTPGCCHA